MGAAEAALEPAWACIREGRHKEPALAATAAAAPGGHSFLRAYTAAWVHVCMATAGVSLLEKRRRYSEACDILRQLLGAHSTPPSLCLQPLQGVLIIARMPACSEP